MVDIFFYQNKGYAIFNIYKIVNKNIAEHFQFQMGGPFRFLGLGSYLYFSY